MIWDIKKCFHWIFHAPKTLFRRLIYCNRNDVFLVGLVYNVVTVECCYNAVAWRTPKLFTRKLTYLWCLLTDFQFLWRSWKLKSSSIIYLIIRWRSDQRFGLYEPSFKKLAVLAVIMRLQKMAPSLFIITKHQRNDISNKSYNVQHGPPYVLYI